MNQKLKTGKEMLHKREILACQRMLSENQISSRLKKFKAELASQELKSPPPEQLGYGVDRYDTSREGSTSQLDKLK